MIVIEHPNVVTIKCADITKITVDDNSVSVSAGQPYSPPVTVHHTGDTWTITIKCGRKGSPEVAQEFVSRVHHIHNSVYGLRAKEMFPSLLNFTFMIHCEFEKGGRAGNIALHLAQGHIKQSVGGYNNWWMGSYALHMGEITVTENGSSNVVGKYKVTDKDTSNDFVLS